MKSGNSGIIKIGMIGSDNSHAIAFSKLINMYKNEHFRVTSIFGIDIARTKDVAKIGMIDNIASHPEDMDVDAVMVVFRDGNLHKKYALPFILSGIPTFVDKPFAIKLDDCKEMIEKAIQSNTLLTSYSIIRYVRDLVDLHNSSIEHGKIQWGLVAGPCDFDSSYGGPYFYGTHTIEMMLAVFGYEIDSIFAKEVSESVIVTVKYKSGVLVNMNFLSPKVKSVFIAGFVGEKGSVVKKIDISECCEEGVKVFLNMLVNKSIPLAFDQLLVPIKLLSIIEKALISSKEEKFIL